MKRPLESMKLKPESKDVINKIYNLEKVKKALEQIVLQEPYTIEEQIEICEMPAPPMKELHRGELIRDKIKAYGLHAEMDPVVNVIARYRGIDPEAPVCAIAAHIDTVFSEDIDVNVRRHAGKLYGPGIACNARGVACMLQVIRALVSNEIRTKGDILFIGTVGEEAEGDLRGVKRIFYTSGMHIDGMLALESSNPGRLLWGSTGSKRYKIEFLGPGGHSFLDFGKSPSATQALCRAGAMLADLEVPEDPKTTFSIGPIDGGTTVNSISEHAECEIDLRSQDNKELDNLVERALPLFAEGAILENERWNVEDEDLKVKCKVTPLGHRPAGEQSNDSDVLQAARAAQEALGIELTEFTSASTDQNVPMSMGIPSTTLGGGGRDGSTHSMAEWYEPL
ncbi:MAG: M20/M25/M40 family metallo-hydrolase, partial [Burkholderiales bacterium]|nr:M20/M25/M40 family metallo-hydrolase [Burkholderiales bacterium]